MELPKNARVVVVDNDHDEVVDLLACLAKDGVATLYYKSQNDFPSNALSGIRLLFLDLELEGLRGQPDKTKASAAASNYSRLVANNNGPLVVVLWTNHVELRPLVSEDIRKVAKNPVFIVCIAKEDCKNANGTFSVELIKSTLCKAIVQADIFGLYISWENAIFKATVNQSYLFSNIAETGENWSEHMSYALYRLYKAYSEKNVLNEVKEQIVSALQLYKDCFLSQLSSALNEIVIENTESFTLKECLSQEDIMKKLKGKINAALLYSNRSCPKHEPGSVYLINNDNMDERMRNLREAISLDFSKAEKKCPLSNPQIMLCKVIITAQCDLAQNKRMCLANGNQCNRIVWGLFVKGNEDMEWLVEHKFNRSYSEYVNFEYQGSQCALFIDLDTIDIDISPLDESSRIFVLNPIPLTDIQTKAANQLNRIGVPVAK